MDSRSVFEHKSFLPVSQGAILNNCIAENYKGCEVWGCVITPRCDLAHPGKVSTVHYLPIVGFDDWLTHDGFSWLKGKWHDQLRKQLNGILKSAGAGEDLIDGGIGKEDLIKLATNFIKKASGLKEYEAKLEMYFDNSDDSFKSNVDKSLVNDLITKLVNGDNHNFYFLEDWKQDNRIKVTQYPYKVIILREIRRLSENFAHKLAQGVEENTLIASDFASNDICKSTSNDNIYYVEEQIKSPFIEHIIQAFSYNFNRIGVEDLEKDRIIDSLKLKSIKTLKK